MKNNKKETAVYFSDKINEFCIKDCSIAIVPDDSLSPYCSKGDKLFFVETKELKHGDFVFIKYYDQYFAGFWWSYLDDDEDDFVIFTFINPSMEPFMFFRDDLANNVKIKGRIVGVFRDVYNEVEETPEEPNEPNEDGGKPPIKILQ